MDLWHLLSADRWKIYLNREISFKNTCQVCVAIKTKTSWNWREKDADKEMIVNCSIHQSQSSGDLLWIPVQLCPNLIIGCGAVPYI